MPVTSFQGILNRAFADYREQIGIELDKHPFVDELRGRDSPDDVLKLLEDKANAFKVYRDGNRMLIDWLSPVVQVVHRLSGILGEAVPFQLANPIFTGVEVLITAANGVSSSYDALVDLFECIGNFLKRLRIYTDISLTPPMMEIIVTIMAELLSVFALATKQIKQGRFKKFAKKLLGESEIEAVLQTLDRLTQEEGRMTVAQTLEVVHGLMTNVKIVMNDGKASMDSIRKALDAMQQMASDINKMRRDHLQKDSKSWLCPPDPSKNYNIGCQILRDETTTWFFRESIFAEWNAKGSLLWIYGKPGSGKSILLSSIIREVDSRRKAGLASMAYFYFDFRESEKRHRRGLLSSLVFQLSAESDHCYRILSRLYSDHVGGTREPSENALSQCLVEMLKVPGQPATYIVIDALDECPNLSGMPTAREQVLEFLEDLVKLNIPNVHICVSSRAEIDIRNTLEPLEPIRMSLHDEVGQKADISSYINTVVRSDRKMRKWREEVRQSVIDTLSDKADGMFRWVYCQLEILRRTLPAHVRSALANMPKTLDETYEHALLEIDEEMRQYAQRLFQCLAVSIRPLCVEELAEVLAVRFDTGALPKFNSDWRLGDAEEAVLSVCSNLISIVDVDGSQVVQFSHFSVKEFLTSDRLATAKEDLSGYHIVPHSAHAILAQASLSVLLQLDTHIDRESIKGFPFSGYAARHWVDHGRFENVSSTIEVAMEQLFNPDKPHFSAWIWVFDIDDPWRGDTFTTHPGPPQAAPLYYAVLCGFRNLIEHLIATCPRDVDAQGGYYESPLLAAFIKEDIDTALSLLQRGANVNVVYNDGLAPLHRASQSGRVDLVRFLLEHNADVNIPNSSRETPLGLASARGEIGVSQLLLQWGADINSLNNSTCTPLKSASRNGHLEVVRFLIDNGATVYTCDDEGWTPLHSASRQGHVKIVEILIQHGADVNKKSNNQQSPLYLASENGILDILQLLVQHGADVNSQINDGSTPLKTAAHKGHLDVIRFLIDNGADVNSCDHGGWTPLHSASREGHMEITDLLIQRGADVNKKNDKQQSALYLASANGRLEIVRLLIQRGADVNSRSNNGWTSLSSASHIGHLEAARLLVASGADVNLCDNRGWTPLHSASNEGHVKIVELLIQHGGDVNKKNDKLYSPLHLVSAKGNVEISQLLVRQGAEVNSRNNNNWTPLKTASHCGYLDVVQFLIDSGADLDSCDNNGWAPLHSAAYNGHLDVVKLLLRRGADVNIRNSRGKTPLDLASNNKKLEIVNFLSGRIGDAVSLDGMANPTPFPPFPPKPQSTGLDVVQSLQNEAKFSDDDKSPLCTASESGQLDIMRSLLDCGSDVNERNTTRQTPLLVASRYGKLEAATLLIEHRADINARDKHGRTPLHLASRFRHLEVARLLLDHGADVNAEKRDHGTALHLAARSGYLEVAKLLLERGANANARNGDGQTPRQTAMALGYPAIAELLSEQGACEA